VELVDPYFLKLIAATVGAKIRRITDAPYTNMIMDESMGASTKSLKIERSNKVLQNFGKIRNRSFIRSSLELEIDRTCNLPRETSVLL